MHRDIFDVEPEEVDYETAKKNLLGTDYWRGIMSILCARASNNRCVVPFPLERTIF